MRPWLWLTLAALCACTADGRESVPPPSPAWIPVGTESRWRDIKTEVRTRFPAVAQMSVPMFARERARGQRTVVVDVRPPHEFAVSHIPGARNAPLASVADDLGDLPRDTSIVVYCSVGWRSSDAATRLQAAGFTNVANLEGSLFEWANRGHELENDAGAAKTVHPFDQSWGELLKPALRAR